MGSQENELISLYIELRDGLRDLEERFYNNDPYVSQGLHGLSRRFRPQNDLQTILQGVGNFVTKSHVLYALHKKFTPRGLKVKLGLAG